VDVLDAIKARRSVREFTGEDVPDEQINAIIEAGMWAPSGLNNQPWKFKVLKGEEKDELAKFTKYAHTIKAAPVCIAVFLDNKEGYNRTKDVQAIGACIQNMLLAIHAFGLGAVWLGEIINRHDEVEKALKAPDGCELMAVIALGKPKRKNQTSERKDLENLLL